MLIDFRNVFFFNYYYSWLIVYIFKCYQQVFDLGTYFSLHFALDFSFQPVSHHHSFLANKESDEWIQTFSFLLYSHVAMADNYAMMQSRWENNKRKCLSILGAWRPWIGDKIISRMRESKSWWSRSSMFLGDDKRNLFFFHISRALSVYIRTDSCKKVYYHPPEIPTFSILTWSPSW